MRSLRCAADAAAAAAAAGGASVHSLQCCDARPLHLSPACSVFSHNESNLQYQGVNKHIKKDDLRAGWGGESSLHCASLKKTEVSSPVYMILTTIGLSLVLFFFLSIISTSGVDVTGS